MERNYKLREIVDFVLCRGPNMFIYRVSLEEIFMFVKVNVCDPPGIFFSVGTKRNVLHIVDIR